MLSSEIDVVFKKIHSVSSIIKFRRIFLEYLPKENEWAGKKMVALIENMPASQNWKIYDHVACFSNLYNIYESFVHSMIAEVIREYEKQCVYIELPNSLKEQHRIGHSEIVKNINSARYSHLSHISLAEEMHKCVSGDPEYKITPEAIYLHDYNINADWLAKIFNRVGFSRVVDWLDRSSSVREVLDGPISEHVRFSSQLKDFIERRNDCAHGDVDQVLGEEQLLFYCDFVKSTCNSVCEFILDNIIRKRLDRGSHIGVGTVIERYKGNIVVVVVTSGKFVVGDKIVVRNQKSCVLAEVLSIQINGESLNEINIHSQTEVGFMLDVKSSKNSCIYTFNEG